MLIDNARTCFIPACSPRFGKKERKERIVTANTRPVSPLAAAAQREIEQRLQKTFESLARRASKSSRPRSFAVSAAIKRSRAHDFSRGREDIITLERYLRVPFERRWRAST